MATLKVNDTVTLNPDCIVGEIYGGLTLQGPMYNDTIGNHLRIAYISANGAIKLHEDTNNLWYTEEMFLKVGPENGQPSLFGIGDEVRIVNDQFEGMKKYGAEGPSYIDHEGVILDVKYYHGTMVTYGYKIFGIPFTVWQRNLELIETDLNLYDEF